jgi:uncharacterized membrane protein YkoI
MRRLLIAAAIAAATVFGAVDTFAQVKVRPAYTPKVMNAPVMKGPVIKTPVIKVIPPSMALSRALMVAPNAKALGVKLKGGHYNVRLKEGKTIRQIRIDAVTGAVSQ